MDINEAKVKVDKRKVASQDKIDFSEQDETSQQSHNLTIPSHRTKPRISYEEYKGYVRAGLTDKDIRKYSSKHIISFYSAMLQGKIKLSKEDFIKDYEDGLSLKEICTKHTVQYDHITFLRDFYAIKRKGANYIKRLNTETEISDEAIEVVIGSLLGDGHINAAGEFREKHSEKQIGYLEWKASHFSEQYRRFYAYKTSKPHFKMPRYSFCFRTNIHDRLIEVRDMFYIPKQNDNKRIKILPNNLEDILTPKILAIWYMDDGSVDFGYRKGVKSSNGLRPQIKLSSQSFTLAENNKLSEILKNKFNIGNGVKSVFSEEKELFCLRLNADGSEKFIALVKEYIHPDLEYKIKYIKRTPLNETQKDDILLNFQEKYK